MNYRNTWKAVWENDVLHISGITDLFPNDFSTSDLERLEDTDNKLTYKIIFHRDKEPFCDKDLVGPVHYFESDLPKNIKKLKIISKDNEYVEITVPANS